MPTLPDDDFDDFDDETNLDDEGAESSAQQPQPQRDRKPNWRRRLEQEAREGREASERAKAAEARAEAAERKALFAELGIKTDSGPGKLFAKAYDGDLDVEKMRAAAQEYGVLAPTDVPDAEQQSHQRVSEAAAGGQSSGAGGDPKVDLDAIPELSSGPGGLDWNPDGPRQVMEWATRNGFTISNEQVAGWERPPAMSTVPRGD